MWLLGGTGCWKPLSRCKTKQKLRCLKDVMVTVQMEQNFQDVEAMKKVAEKAFKMAGDNKVLVEDAWVHNPRDAVPRRLQQKWDVESNH